MKTFPCQIAEGQRIDLNEIPTQDNSHFPVTKKEGEKVLASLLEEIDELQCLLYAEGKRRFLVIFQAMDTGGKDGAIRDVFNPMDPQGIRVVSFRRPSEAELARDFLWRVHLHVPQNGETVVFNRSHYEDIVAVRVRGILPEERWKKRYQHIVAFEKMLADEGTTIVKFFLHISRDEQKKRLQARLDDPRKHWKFNPSDLQDRALWPQFMEAFSDVISKTSTAQNPWYVVPSDQKWQRNLIVAKIVADTLKSLKMTYPPISYDPKTVQIDG